jgi:hypothetical protein
MDKDSGRFCGLRNHGLCYPTRHTLPQRQTRVPYNLSSTNGQQEPSTTPLSRLLRKDLPPLSSTFSPPPKNPLEMLTLPSRACTYIRVTRSTSLHWTIKTSRRHTNLPKTSTTYSISCLCLV